MKNKYSKNPKLNAVLTDIEDQLLAMCDTEEESLSEIAHYMWFYPTVSNLDYMIAQHGNLLFTYDDVYSLYREAGYKTTDTYSLDRIWNTYRRQVGYVARQLIKATNTPIKECWK